ncbi:Hypothetical predicted protein [Cloeon dipterum]|uniref:Uncharacterized protein n=1 Tax=Cloeon dipterum TaxID=197152 RepID=A0A8S1CNV1_9INSE|nr:Hypothetical predicted protein [Cloeon dipterum]
MNGLKNFKPVLKLKSEQIVSSNNTSNTNKAGDTRYPEFEDDDAQRDGKVFVVRRGVDGKSDKETVLHHWAIAVKFDDGKWVTFEGVNEDGMLVPGYSSSHSKPSGTVIDIECSPIAGLQDDLVLQYFLVFTQLLKSLSFESVRFIRASPRDLHKLAGNTLRAPVKTLTNAGFKAASTVTNTGLEALNTVGRVFSGEENPATALVDGAGKTTNHVITGVSDTAAGAVDGVAGFAVNAIGLVTGGGCATKNGLCADIKSLQEEVRSGRMSNAEAFVQGVGKAAGKVVYGVANTTTNVIGGVADTATGLVSGVAGTVAAPFKALDSLAEDIARGEINPVLGVVAAPVVIVGAVAEGVGKTVVNVVIMMMYGLKKLSAIFKLKGVKIESCKDSCNTYKAGDTRYPKYEKDNDQRHGKVFIVRKGVGGKSDEETILHHWAIAVKFDDGKWVTFEGVNEDGLLLPGYSSSYSKPSGTIIDIEDSPMASLKQDQASPRDLHKLAGSIPEKPYCAGVNDCQTWFLDALRKLQSYEIGTKSMGDCAFDTLRAPLKTATNTGFKAASTVTNTGLEAYNTIKRVVGGKENPITAFVDGAGKTVNHVISGLSDTAAGAVDGVAGFAVNAIGLVTGGGCATKNGLDADMKSLQEEVRSGRMNATEAKFQTIGKAAGSVVYKIANTIKNVIGNIASKVTEGVSKIARLCSIPLLRKIHQC